MAWALRSKSASVASASSGNITLTEPSGASQGDLLVACIGYRDSAAFTASGDWSSVGTQQSSGDTDSTSGIGSGGMWYCIRGSSAPSYVFTRTAGDIAQGTVLCFTGGASASILDSSDATTDSTITSTHTLGALIPSIGGDLIVLMYSGGDNTGATSGYTASIHPTTGWTEEEDSSTNTGADHTLAVAWATTESSGSTGTFTVTSTGTARSVLVAGAFKAGARSITTDLGSLTVTGQAPEVTTQQTLYPGVGALTVTGYAPTATKQTNIQVGVGSLTITGFEPTVDVTASERMRVSWLALKLPQSGNFNVSVPAGALSITGHAPTIFGGNTAVSVGVGALTIDGIAPTVTTQVSVSPGAGALSITGYAPSITTTSDTAITPDAGALVITGQAPAVTVQYSVNPGVGALSITGYAPTVNVLSDGQILVQTGTLQLTGRAPTVTTQQSVAPSVGELTITGQASSVTTQETVGVGVGALTIAGHAPSIDVTTASSILVPVGTLELTGYAPTVTTQETVTSDVGELSLTGYAPSISVVSDTAVTPGAGALTIAGHAPTVDILLNVLPGVGQIIITGHAPTVTGGTASVVPVTQQPAGSSKKRRRRKYQVEIDGQTFDVESPQEAADLLSQAEEVAREQAQKATEKAANAPKRQKRKVLADARKALSMPQVRVVGSDTDPVAAQIEQQARAFVDRVTKLYQEALQAVEIGAILRKQALEQEEEDLITVLMMTL